MMISFEIEDEASEEKPQTKGNVDSTHADYHQDFGSFIQNQDEGDSQPQRS